MITWMQRHRKYLVITIWISTIAFIGAGVVGWGQYSYGDKAGSVAKVGDVSISASELQRAYSNLFNQYNQMFQGQLDQKKAEQFGLQRQALQQLVNQALVLNLAQSYGLVVTDDELLEIIKSQPAFAKDGNFDKGAYEAALKQNGMSIKEYEEAMRKELLIQKTLFLLSSGAEPFETQSIQRALGVADKISYKLLTPATVDASSDDNALKAFWEKHQKEFMTEPTYEISFVRQGIQGSSVEESAAKEYYENNRQQFKNTDGKLQSFEEARGAIQTTLGLKAAEKEALRLYIDYKKGVLDPKTPVEKATLTATSSPFNPELSKEIMGLRSDKPFLKPRKVENGYVIVKLDRYNAPRQKSFEEAKTEANAMFMMEAKKEKLQELAKNSYKSFTGISSDFVTRADGAKISGLSETEGNEFLSKLFSSKQKQGYITLSSGNVIIYNVLEQKLLQDTPNGENGIAAKLKGNLLDQGLIKTLESKYPVEIYVKGI